VTVGEKVGQQLNILLQHKNHYVSNVDASQNLTTPMLRNIMMHAKKKCQVSEAEQSFLTWLYLPVIDTLRIGVVLYFTAVFSILTAYN